MPKAVKISKKTLDLIEAECDIHAEDLKAFHMKSYLIVGMGIDYPWMIVRPRIFKRRFKFVGKKIRNHFTEVVKL